LIAAVAVLIAFEKDAEERLEARQVNEWAANQ
jgi:hypothetical protein